MAFYAPLLVKAERICAEDVYDYYAPLMSRLVSIDDWQMQLLHGWTNLGNAPRR